MRAVVQRVTNADVKIDGRVNGKIDDGFFSVSATVILKKI